MRHLSSSAESREAPASSACDCTTDPIGCLEQMFVEQVQKGRIARGQAPARRPVFLRLHGVAYGRFEVASDLPEDLRVGLFVAGRSYPAWVRYSSDIPDSRPDLKSTVGIGIKLFDVQGEKILPPDEHAPTADFLLQNIDVFFVDDARQMCEFTQASLGGKLDEWLADHPRTKEILDQMEKLVSSALATELWSVIPFRFGDGDYAKYKIEPEEVPGGPLVDPDPDDPNYLRKDLERRLSVGEARYRFLVQRRTDPATMPLDEATVPWSEEASKPIHVATLVLPRQDVTARGQAHYGETLAFNPWRTIPEHEPVGTIADARKVVYQASARVRRNTDGEPVGEATEVRPEGPFPLGRAVVRAAIHPAIGVARIGDSRDPNGFYIGPEVPHPPHATTAQMRDSKGAIKRQAARFRIYGYDAQGQVVGELTPANAGIRWTVHLANKKAAWYRFEAALDLPQANTMKLPRRNAGVTGASRRQLVIDPGPRSISGSNTEGAPYRFNGGKFLGVEVPLGELRTDGSGRLLVLGGHGFSSSPEGKPIFDPADPQTFNNADGWHDDISDGTVTARVTMNGRELPVEPSWVVVAPPDYGPDFHAWRTLYDLLTDGAIENGQLPLPEPVSFTNHVLPILRRLSGLQWVNAGFSAFFSRGGVLDFEDPALLARLAKRPASPGDADPYQELRRTFANAFRPSDTDNDDPRPWPWIYGDAFGSFDGQPQDNLALSPVRGRIMRRWVQGDFVDDYLPSDLPPARIQDVPLAQQPATLDRAALDFCLADAFHPGCEMTWPMRHASMYGEPHRIRHRPAGQPDADYGRTLNQAKALQVNGPLYAQGPGDISRWMALPWQADTAFCRSGYEPAYDPYVPTFWPARVPNNVLTEDDYAIVIDTSRPREQRVAAFNRRELWLRSLIADNAPAPEVMKRMVARFGTLGIIEARPGVPDDPDFPATIWVESLPVEEIAVQARKAVALLAAEPDAPARRVRLSQAGWASEEQLAEFRDIRIRIRR